MKIQRCISVVAIGLLLTIGCNDADPPADDNGEDPKDEVVEEESVRVATFNASLYREEAGQLKEELDDPDHQQAREIAEIIQVKRPDVLLVNEFDYDEDDVALERFADNFLAQPQGDEEAIDYEYRYAFPSNTGVPSGKDLDDNGVVGDEEGTEDYANDAFGYGLFPGQYAFAVYSKHPLDTDDYRSFKHFLWQDMPGHRIPEDFYEDDELEILRLSSKNHVDLPVDIGDHRLHLLASHPTPPAFDGPEQRNVRRNQDEIRLWHDYIRPDHADYLYDDDGVEGGLEDDAYFVIAGDLNSDPNDSDEMGAVGALLDSARTTDPKPSSQGGVVSSEEQGGANDVHEGDPKYVTSEWNPDVGNMRVDYAIPSSNLVDDDAGVFWPTPDEPYADLVEATDHRLVWVDVTLGGE